MTLQTAADGRSTAPRWCELPDDFRPQEFRIQWASGPWMDAQARALRRQVFCVEQGLFRSVGGDDTDATDHDNPSTRTLVALSCWGGQPDEVLGTVRIHAAAPGLWWGSRLAVRADWRHSGKLGTALIRLAVRSAHALGCNEFLAHVQAQHLPLFQHLHWQLLDMVDLHGRPHGLMRADLAQYPVCSKPFEGLVLAPGDGRKDPRHG